MIRIHEPLKIKRNMEKDEFINFLKHLRKQKELTQFGKDTVTEWLKEVRKSHINDPCRREMLPRLLESVLKDEDVPVDKMYLRSPSPLGENFHDLGRMSLSARSDSERPEEQPYTENGEPEFHARKTDKFLATVKKNAPTIAQSFETTIDTGSIVTCLTGLTLGPDGRASLRRSSAAAKSDEQNEIGECWYRGEDPFSFPGSGADDPE